MLDASHFASGVRARRYPKDKVVDEGETLRPLERGKKPFSRDMILLETDDFYLVSYVPVHRGGAILTVNMDPGWNIVSSFVTGRSRPGEVEGRGLGGAPVTYADLDRAVNVLQDMGRWDVAFRMILELFGCARLPNAAVVWDTFPHRSKMLLMTSATTGIYLSGAMKDVVEKWWAYCGGYHGKECYVVPDAEYHEFMSGIRNPFALAGVDRHAASERVARDLHMVECQPEDVEPTGAYWVHRGVVYLAAADGKVLPYWYTSAEGDEPPGVAWNRGFRQALASRMNLPLLVQRQVEEFLPDDLG